MGGNQRQWCGANHPDRKENFLYIDTLAWMGMPNTTAGVHSLEGALGMHNKNPTYARRHFNFDGPLVPVESAFGGVAIYRYSSVVGCRYSMGTTKARSRNGKQATHVSTTRSTNAFADRASCIQVL